MQWVSRYSALLRAVVLWILIVGIGVSLLVMMMGSLGHDESHEREELSKIMQQQK